MQSGYRSTRLTPLCPSWCFSTSQKRRLYNTGTVSNQISNIDLTPYIARGFSGDIDQTIAKTPVVGIDREQTQSMVRLCDATEPTLYGPDFSPTRIRYRPGSRPIFERIVKSFTADTPRGRVEQATRWVVENVKHTHLIGPLAADRGVTEEQLIESGQAWCNEQARVFIALCQVMNIAARLCFLFHQNTRSGHATTEVYLNGRWAWCDQTFAMIVDLPDGRPAEARDLSGPMRGLAHEAYRPKLQEHYKHIQPFVEDLPAWNKNDRPNEEAGGDLMHEIGITNYIIGGVDVV